LFDLSSHLPVTATSLCFAGLDGLVNLFLNARMLAYVACKENSQNPSICFYFIIILLYNFQ